MFSQGRLPSGRREIRRIVISEFAEKRETAEPEGIMRGARFGHFELSYGEPCVRGAVPTTT